MVFIKNRDSSNQDGWFDSLRRSSEGSYFPIHTHSTDAHDSDGSQFADLTEFTPNGFKLGNQYSSIVYDQNENHVAWTWKAGGNKNTFNVDDVGYASAAAAGLTGGSYSLTGASVGTKQGFSIVQWTHSTNTAGTINHGLTEAPTFIIYKSTANATRWTVGHNSLGWNTGLVLNSSDAKLADDAAYFNNTAPTSSVFSIGDTGQIGNGNTIAYLWHDVPGLQKFGSFTGNNSTDGAFVELGFRAKLIIYKVNQDSHNWMIFDSERDKDNPCSASLRGNLTNAESSFSALDITSTGFKFRNTDTNPNNAQIIYMAWADVPSVDLYGGGANAR